jgi:hypothetical protein
LTVWGNRQKRVGHRPFLDRRADVNSDSWEGRKRLMPSLTHVQKAPPWRFLGNFALKCNGGSLWENDTWQLLKLVFQK